MFRSILNKLRGKSSAKKAAENQAASTSEAEAKAGVDPDTTVVPLGVGAARKSVISTPLPIPSPINDPVEGEDEATGILAHGAEGTELPDGALNPIAAASASASGSETEFAAAAEVDLATDPVVEFEIETEAEPIADQVIISAEELCGIDAESMDREEIRTKLAVLYRRYNAVASSLNADLRAEAELMLDAIVACREAYVDHL